MSQIQLMATLSSSSSASASATTTTTAIEMLQKGVILLAGNNTNTTTTNDDDNYNDNNDIDNIKGGLGKSLGSLMWKERRKVGAPEVTMQWEPEEGFPDLQALGVQRVAARSGGPRVGPLKSAWVRSQIVGKDLSFLGPFGERLLTYADHTASGRSLLYVENLILKYVLPVYGNTHTDDSYTGSVTSKLVHESANYIKQCLGGGPEDALLFCGSGCTAAIKRLQEVMGLAVPSTLRSRVLEMVLQTEERWVVFTGPYEHHSNLLSWRQSLAQVIDIPMDKDGSIDVACLKAYLESPEFNERPKLGFFSACSNVTGLVTNTREITTLLHTYGAFAAFDFAASAPHTEINMRSGEMDGYDAIVLSPHKMLGGPGTPGLLLMHKSLYLLNNNPPSTCGGGTTCFVNGFNDEDTLYYEEVEEREDAGTPPIIQKIRCALCMWVKEYIGHSYIQERESYLLQIAMKRLKANTNIQILGNPNAIREPILSFIIYTKEVVKDSNNNDNNNNNNNNSNNSYSESSSLSRCHMMWRERRVKMGKPLHGRFVVKLLNDLFGIQARGGCSCAGPYGHALLNVTKEQSVRLRAAVQKGYHGLKPGWARISFSYYMTDAEFDYLLSAIEFVAVYGQRFLSLYDFSFESGDWSYKRIYKPTPCYTTAMVYSNNDGHNMSSGCNSNSSSSSSSPDCIRKEEEAKKMSEEEKMSMYLDTARAISKTLSKFPLERPLPRNIYKDHLLFCV